MAWGKEWVSEPVAPIKNWPTNDPENTIAEITSITQEMLGIKPTLKKQGSNLVDNAQYLYFQCETCQALFDPETKSFATLNQKRYNAGWKVKWNVSGMGYKVYCVKCGEDME